MTGKSAPDQVDIIAEVPPLFAKVLSPAALHFVARLQREFEPRRRGLLSRRANIQTAIDADTLPDFLEVTEPVRPASWQVAPVPPDLQNRRVEITAPVERKMMINALNSGANVFMADFEDANSPTWSNIIQGQINLCDTVEQTITYTSPEGKYYQLG